MSTHLKPRSWRLAPIISVLGLAALAACDRMNTPQTVETTGEKVDAVITKVDDGIDTAKTEIKQEAQQMKAATQDAMQQTKEAAGDAAQSVAQTVSDVTIMASVKTKLAQDDELKALKINVQTTEGHVSLHGTAPSESSRVHARQLAATVKGVVSVNNQLTVEPNS